MKKIIHLKGLLWHMVLIALLASIQIASGQTGQQQTSPIPDNINKIFKTSCYGCHGSNGRLLPKTKLNFSKWSEYGAEKEASLASKICLTLIDGSMPPKSARKSAPELVPTKEQTELVCKWADSLKPKAEVK